MRDEHRRLRELLLQIEQNWNAANEGNAEAPELASGLQALRSELAHHFAEEEEGGCLEEAACRCPSLTTEVRRVEDEHAKLLGDLDKVIAGVPAAPTAGVLAGPHQAFERFTAELRAHEAAENHLLETAFGCGVES